jgi:hypothetical protein
MPAAGTLSLLPYALESIEFARIALPQSRYEALKRLSEHAAISAKVP